ncbi:MAG: MMPL family transporter [Sandaracinaceae bacterium]|nr:MMPL family transporter [Sandaracinaceae bacterium]
MSEGPTEAPSLLSRGLSSMGRFVVARAGLVVALLVGSLVPTGWLALDLEIRASFLDLLPADEEPVHQLHEVIGHARSASDIAIAISTEDRAMAERYAEAFVAEVSHDPEIAGIGGHIDMDWLLDRRLLFVPEDELESLVSRAEGAIDRELLRHTGLYIDLEEPSAAEQDDSQSLLREVDEADDHVERDEWVVTSDGRYLCLWALFSGNTGDLDFGRHAFDRVRAIDARLRDGTRFPRTLEVRFAGGIPTRVDDEAAIRSDLSVAGVVGFVAVVLLIVASLRAPRALVILAVPLFIGLVWTFAFARLAVGHLNIISGFLFSILSGLGIEYGIHLMHRFRELRDEGVALEPAIEDLVEKTGRALLSGSMTNASVFGVIAFAQFSGFSEFGLIAAVGLVLTLIVTMLGLPALLVLFERWRPIGKSADEAMQHTPLHVPDALRWTIVVGVPVLSILSIVVLVTGRVRFDGNWRLLAGNSETTQFQEYLRHHFSGLYTGGLIYVPPETELSRVVEVVEGVRAARLARGEHTDVVEIDTLDEAFPPPERQRARAAIALRLGEQLARIRPEQLDDAGRERLAEGQRVVAAAQPIAIEELPYALVGPFVTNDGRGSILHLRMHETDDASTDVLVRWAHEAREIVRAIHDAGLTAPLLSENWIAGEIFERVARDARYLLVGTLAAVFVVLLLDFRKPLVALGVLGAVLLGVLGIAGGMFVTGLQLNFMNAAILPVCVGISLDNAIHVYHRWRESGPGSIPMVLRHTTRANALASTTNLLGFAALALTHHEGLRSVAWLAVIGVTATYVSTTLWFPMVFATIDARRAKREA